MKPLRIGELAQSTGVTVETLRFYEKQGLLPLPERTAAGYRVYSEDSIKRVAFILRAKEVGFSLQEINELLSLQVNSDQTTCQEVKGFAQNKLATIDSKIAELKRMQQALTLITDACCGGPAAATHCTILSALEGETTATEEGDEHDVHQPLC